ncbi:scm-like with four MBT domains protein 1 [Anopheles nili]|uniref:scm-like with four MBT domains protein 1 n=1 Tax=Anopheles nili TaxID=185578 RepID=UPI00237BBD0F|nr:scm-like with four MBT domains protein 1 [Anopheles nili]
MGKSSQVPVDHDSSSDRITARVGSRTKKAKVVFDPSDHHVPRKRNRRGETDFVATPSPKLESNRTATPSSPSSTDGSNNIHMPSTPPPPVVQRATTSSFRFCQKCGKNGPGRMPRKTTVAPWTCPGCLVAYKTEKTVSSKQRHSQNQLPQSGGSDRAAEEEDEEDDDEENDDEEEDTKQQQDFAGFSETELSGHGNANDGSTEDRLSQFKEENDAESENDDDLSSSRTRASYKRESVEQVDKDDESKEIRYWSCDDVCRYFGRHCKAWGDLFHEQEIDGPSLLLMRKVDVLSRFGLKLGPAMELYQRIVALQNGDRDIVDVRLTWI